MWKSFKMHVQAFLKNLLQTIPPMQFNVFPSALTASLHTATCTTLFSLHLVLTWLQALASFMMNRSDATVSIFIKNSWCEKFHIKLSFYCSNKKTNLISKITEYYNKKAKTLSRFVMNQQKRKAEICKIW